MKDAEWWQLPPKPTEIVAAYLIASAITVWAAGIAWQAWAATPDAPDFRHYVDHITYSSKPKADYIFGPVLLAAMPLVAFWIRALAPMQFVEWLMPGAVRGPKVQRWHMLGMIGWFIAIALITRHQAKTAIDAGPMAILFW